MVRAGKVKDKLKKGNHASNTEEKERENPRRESASKDMSP